MVRTAAVLMKSAATPPIATLADLSERLLRKAVQLRTSRLAFSAVGAHRQPSCPHDSIEIDAHAEACSARGARYRAVAAPEILLGRRAAGGGAIRRVVAAGPERTRGSAGGPARWCLINRHRAHHHRLDLGKLNLYADGGKSSDPPSEPSHGGARAPSYLVKLDARLMHSRVLPHLPHHARH